jgi:hypothetical protein
MLVTTNLVNWGRTGPTMLVTTNLSNWGRTEPTMLVTTNLEYRRGHRNYYRYYKNILIYYLQVPC